MENRTDTALTEVQTPEVLEVQQQTPGLVERVSGIEVTNPESAQLAAGVAGKIAGALKTIERVRKIAKEPYLVKGRAIDSFFTMLSDPLTKAKKVVDAKIGAYVQAEENKKLAREAEIEKEKRRLEAAEAKARENGQEKRADNLAAKSDVLANTTVAAAPTTIRGMAGGTVSVIKTWKHRIVNRDLVPDRYWVVDESLIAEAVRAGARNPDIAGVDVYEDIQTRTRS